jgi:hypothetical protein
VQIASRCWGGGAYMHSGSSVPLSYCLQC